MPKTRTAPAGELIAVDVTAEELEPDELAVYCPKCWELEFGLTWGASDYPKEGSGSL